MFEGVLTALVTPFRDGAIDQQKLRDLVDLQVAGGVDGLVPCGTTGESATLSYAEHRQVIEIVVEAAAGRVAVVAGTGSNNTREAIEFTVHAREAGADGALLISPYYNKPTQQGIVEHFAAIAREAAFPLIPYNVPSRTSSNILPDTVVQLAEIEHVVGIKEACGDIGQIGDVIARVPADFAVLSGDDSMTLPLLALGGRGVISVTSNVAPALMAELVHLFQSGNVAGARAVHQRLLPLSDALFCETNPIPVKAALEIMGRIGPEIRLPLTPLGEGNRERLQVVMKEVGIL